MIIVTFKGAPPPLPYRAKGVTWRAVVAGPSPAAALADAMKHFPDEHDCFLYVAPGGRVATAPVYDRLKARDFDVAACVDRIGSIPAKPKQFDGIGNVSLDAVLIRPTPGARRLVDRWLHRNDAYPGRESVNFCVALAETKEVAFAFLGPDWRWIESAMRPVFGSIVAVPAVSFGEKIALVKSSVEPKISDLSTESRPKPPVAKKRGPEVVWVGHLYQYTGYGKMNREVLFRVANTLSVRLDDTHKEPCYVSEDLRSRLDVHKHVLAGPNAPLLRVMGPDHITTGKRHRIVWTMQESSHRVHPDMAKRANENFDELWTPTAWNIEVFRDSGVRLPMRVMRLGVDPLVYTRRKPEPLPECRLISTSRRGLRGVPDGFTFLTIGLPGFRKGWDVLADAAELAFAGGKKVSVVIGLTHAPTAWKEKIYRQFARYKVPIWTLEGSFDEYELARIYSSVGAYVSASRGEGFNLPALEAGACGTPVVVPNNTAHTEVFYESLMFKPDGEKVYPEGDWISDWYKGMLFSRFGKRSIRVLADMLETVRSGDKFVRRQADNFYDRIRRELTWDIAATSATSRLLEVQP
jgi:glycosyltransferase involved in cell wall biosynthesis